LVSTLGEHRASLARTTTQAGWGPLVRRRTKRAVFGAVEVPANL
jgi:hypothetical protein